MSPNRRRCRLLNREAIKACQVPHSRDHHVRTRQRGGGTTRSRTLNHRSHLTSRPGVSDTSLGRSRRTVTVLVGPLSPSSVGLCYLKPRLHHTAARGKVLLAVPVCRPLTRAGAVMLLQSHAEGAGSARFCWSMNYATDETAQASPPSPRLRARMFPITSDGGCGLLGISRRRWLAGRPLGGWLWSHLMRVRGGRGGFITQACGFREHPCYGGDPARWTRLMTYLTFLLWTGCWTSLSLPLRCLPARSRPARNQGHLWQLDHQPVHLRGSDRFD